MTRMIKAGLLSQAFGWARRTVNGRKGNHATWLTNELAKKVTTEVSAQRRRAPQRLRLPRRTGLLGTPADPQAVASPVSPRQLPRSAAWPGCQLPFAFSVAGGGSQVIGVGGLPSLIRHPALESTSVGSQYWVKNVNVAFSRVNEIKLIWFSGSLPVGRMDGKRCLSIVLIILIALQNFLARLLSKYCSSGTRSACHNLS